MIRPIRRSKLKIALVFPVLSPGDDGIGDYTLELGRALCEHSQVHLFSSQVRPDLAQTQGKKNLLIHESFAIEPRKGFLQLGHALARDPPDALVLQYNPFSYGKYGINPYVSRVLREAKQALPDLKIATMVHEPFVPWGGVKQSLLSAIHRNQLRAICASSDILFASIEPWTQMLQSWFPRKRTHHLPVGSNIPELPATRQESRARLGLPQDRFVIGAFGGAHPSRLVELIVRGSREIQAALPGSILLSAGEVGRLLRPLCGGLNHVELGKISSDQASLFFRALDLYLCPFVDGVSTRRTSFVTGLQHGVAILGTQGHLTDALLSRKNGICFSLTPANDPASFAADGKELALDPELRARYGENGRRFFSETLDWPILAKRLVLGLTST